MDTILNVGLNDQTVLSLVKATNNERFAWDCYRRFIQMYGDVVLGVQKREGEDHEPFETVIESYKHEKYHKDIIDSDLTAGNGAAGAGAQFGAGEVGVRGSDETLGVRSEDLPQALDADGGCGGHGRIVHAGGPPVAGCGQWHDQRQSSQRLGPGRMLW